MGTGIEIVVGIDEEIGVYIGMVMVVGVRVVSERRRRDAEEGPKLISMSFTFVNRLGISYPELTEMQVRAIFQAAVTMTNQGIKVIPEIMVPLVGTPQELGHQVSLIRCIGKKVLVEMGSSLRYKVGTMIEIPRAALIADEIAKEAELFSFGTNDLKQMTFGYSRDDVGKFLPIYLSQGILQHDPFEVSCKPIIIAELEKAVAFDELNLSCRYNDGHRKDV